MQRCRFAGGARNLRISIHYSLLGASELDDAGLQQIHSPLRGTFRVVTQHDTWLDLLVAFNQILIERIGKSRARTTKPHLDRKSTRLNSSHLGISYAVFC